MAKNTHNSRCKGKERIGITGKLAEYTQHKRTSTPYILLHRSINRTKIELMKKTLKWVGLAILALVVVLGIYLAIVLPMGEKSDAEMTDEMIDILRGKMVEDYRNGEMKRDAHPKCLGLAKGVFTVDSTLDTNLNIGVFQAGKSYPAILRFSNASGTVESDAQKDFRGLGIKLIGVEGTRYDSTEINSQDFILMTNPTMPLGTVRLFYYAVYYSIQHGKLALLAKMILSGNMNVLKQLANGPKHDTSPLDITYWSTTPYALGSSVVKYKLVPTSKTKSSLPNPLSDHYLTENLKAQLEKDSASFDFYIQLFENEQNTPVEDAAIEWQSPFVKVATLSLPKQDIDTKTRWQLAEQLFYSPANALEANRPVGGLNIARAKIYRTLTEFRHETNGQELTKPSLELFRSLK